MSELCYNRGCGLRFQPHSNTDDACCYHPGVPIFHDALKGWSCCKKKTIDFSEFLAIPGCTKGHHSNVKPLKPEVTCNKDPTDNMKLQIGTEYIIKGPKSAESMKRERPSSDEPVVKLPQKVSKSLQESLEKLSESTQEIASKIEENASSEVKVGTLCKNAGCKKTFQGPESNQETCNFHPGIPIFHEGMKYWSCCKIKTTEFEEFIEQPGCIKGKHLWTKKEADKKLVGCRHDWHQTSSVVVFTIYAKTSNPELSYVDANRTTLTIHIMFEQDKVFHKVLNLWGVDVKDPMALIKEELGSSPGVLANIYSSTNTTKTDYLVTYISVSQTGVIDVKKSFVNMGSTKVEISLNKMDPVTWAKLEMPPHKVEEKEEKEKNEKEEKEKESKPLAQEKKEMYFGEEPPPLEDDESDDSFGLSDTDEEFD